MIPSERRARLERTRLYLVTGASRPDFAAFLETVLAAGVDAVQVREKTWEAAPILRACAIAREACDRHGALLFVNDRVDLAIAAGADGVHVGQDDLDPATIRARFGDDLLVGRSTHTPEQLTRGLDEPADYVCAGPVHETPTKPGRPATGLDLVRLAAKEATKPWFAIGGIDERTVGDVVDAGASRIVVVRAINEAGDPAAAVRALRAALPDPA